MCKTYKATISINKTIFLYFRNYLRVDLQLWTLVEKRYTISILYLFVGILTRSMLHKKETIIQIGSVATCQNGSWCGDLPLPHDRLGPDQNEVAFLVWKQAGSWVSIKFQ